MAFTRGMVRMRMAALAFEGRKTAKAMVLLDLPWQQQQQPCLLLKRRLVDCFECDVLSLLDNLVGIYGCYYRPSESIDQRVIDLNAKSSTFTIEKY